MAHCGRRGAQRRPWRTLGSLGVLSLALLLFGCAAPLGTPDAVTASPSVGISGFATSTPSPTPIANGLCDLLLAPQVLDQLVGQTFGPPQETTVDFREEYSPTGEVRCASHSTGTGSLYVVDIDLMFRAALVDATEAFNDWRTGSASQNPANITSLTGIGDEAFWAANQQDLFFRKQAVIGYLHVAGPYASTAARLAASQVLAQSLISRLP